MKKITGLFNPKGIFMRISLIFCLLPTLCLTLCSAAGVKAQYGLDKKIDINSLLAGNYIVKVTSDEKTFSTNLIIQ